jgi:hypothetical protein
MERTRSDAQAGPSGRCFGRSGRLLVARNHAPAISHPRQETWEAISQTEAIMMKQAIYAVTAFGLVWLLVSMAPDIRRYMRMRAM